ncbi:MULTISPECIES: phasin family protein [Shewanella]|uniref:Phasin family protein n=1 Tax=Shewanella sedimentimangrovi TaxID=2814293 RepID=A0ABX7R217_9GAMM|nr:MULTISPECIES: phasin family protein [Shewanella]QSX37818.1 phasin family protein [Shewanella sedimentimangrovi]QSX41377.1 phasin family protein [Shewanella cyperi]
MDQNLFNSFSEQAQKMFKPVSDINRLMVDNIQMVTDFQLTTLKTYTDLQLQQWKSATEIRDPDSLQSYVKGQMDFMVKVNQQMVEDSKTLADMGQRFRDQMQQILGENNPVKPAAKAPAKAV